VQELGGAAVEADGSELAVGAGKQNHSHLLATLRKPVESLLTKYHQTFMHPRVLCFAIAGLDAFIFCGRILATGLREFPKDRSIFGNQALGNTSGDKRDGNRTRHYQD
jgi:hypothetical protein